MVAGVVIEDKRQLRKLPSYAQETAASACKRSPSPKRKSSAPSKQWKSTWSKPGWTPMETRSWNMPVPSALEQQRTRMPFKWSGSLVNVTSTASLEDFSLPLPPKARSFINSSPACLNPEALRLIECSSPMPVRPKSAGAAPQQSARTNSSGVQEIFSSSSEAFHVQDAFKKSINTSPACEGLASMSPQPLSGKHLELKRQPDPHGYSSRWSQELPQSSQADQSRPAGKTRIPSPPSSAKVSKREHGYTAVAIDAPTSACGTDGASPANPSAPNDGACSDATAALIQVDHHQANQTEGLPQSEHRANDLQPIESAAIARTLPDAISQPDAAQQPDERAALAIFTPEEPPLHAEGYADKPDTAEPLANEPVHVLSTHRIASLEHHVDLHSNLQSANATGSQSGCAGTTAMETSSSPSLEAALGSLDISGRPVLREVTRLPQVSEEDVNIVPVFKGVEVSASGRFSPGHVSIEGSASFDIAEPGAAVCDHSAGLGSLSRPDNEASDEPATLASAQDSKDSKQQEGLTAFVGHVHTKDPAVKAATTGVETRSVGGVSNGWWRRALRFKLCMHSANRHPKAWC